MSGEKVKLLSSKAVFSPVIDEFLVPDHQRLNRELVVAIADWQKEDPGIQRSNFAGWHSGGNIFKRTEAPFLEVCRHFLDSVRPPLMRHMAPDNLKSRKFVLEGWVNVNRHHAYNHIHTHDRFELSGVYFVKIPPPSHPLSGALQFVNPSYRGGGSELFDKMNPQAMTVTPSEGHIIVFPSTMPHWVLPNDEDAERISIAFNARLK